MVVAPRLRGCGPSSSSASSASTSPSSCCERRSVLLRGSCSRERAAQTPPSPAARTARASGSCPPAESASTRTRAWNGLCASRRPTRGSRPCSSSRWCHSTSGPRWTESPRAGPLSACCGASHTVRHAWMEGASRGGDSRAPCVVRAMLNCLAFCTVPWPHPRRVYAARHLARAAVLPGAVTNLGHVPADALKAPAWQARGVRAAPAPAPAGQGKGLAAC